MRGFLVAGLLVLSCLDMITACGNTPNTMVQMEELQQSREREEARNEHLSMPKVTAKIGNADTSNIYNSEKDRQVVKEYITDLKQGKLFYENSKKYDVPVGYAFAEIIKRTPFDSEMENDLRSVLNSGILIAESPDQIPLQLFKNLFARTTDKSICEAFCNYLKALGWHNEFIIAKYWYQQGRYDMVQQFCLENRFFDDEELLFKDDAVWRGVDYKKKADEEGVIIYERSNNGPTSIYINVFGHAWAIGIIEA